MSEKEDSYIGGEKEAQREAEGQIKRVWFEVGGEPFGKERPRVAGHAYTPKKTKDKEEEIALTYKSIYHGFKFEKGVPLKVEMDFYFGIPKATSKKKRVGMEKGEVRPTKRPDIDNVQKLVLDASNGVVWADDSQVVEVVARKHWSDRPRIEVGVMEI